MLKETKQELRRLNIRIRKRIEGMTNSNYRTEINKHGGYADMTLMEIMEWLITLKVETEYQGVEFYPALVQALHRNRMNGPIRNMIYQTIRKEWPHLWREGIAEEEPKKVFKPSKRGSYSVEFSDDEYVATHGDWEGLIGTGDSPLKAMEELNALIKESVEIHQGRREE